MAETWVISRKCVVCNNVVAHTCRSLMEVGIYTMSVLQPHVCKDGKHIGGTPFEQTTEPHYG